MTNVFIFTFTSHGQALGERLVTDYLSAPDYHAQASRVSNLFSQTKRAFQTGNVLIFIGACGIAVRAIAPLVQTKLTDPAVIVIDEAGHYVIPVLSGHLGGANQIALKLADWLGAQAVITTASDVRQVFSVDQFARDYGYHLVEPRLIKSITARLLHGQPVGFQSAYPIVSDIPTGLVVDDSLDYQILIGQNQIVSSERTLQLIPRSYVVGIGARKGSDAKALDDFFRDSLAQHGIAVELVGRISSIDLKQSEPALVELAHRYRMDFVTYPADELNQVAEMFSQSDFVRHTTGTGNVCEASAYLASGRGRRIQPRLARNGLTMAIFQADWQVRFSNVRIEEL